MPSYAATTLRDKSFSSGGTPSIDKLANLQSDIVAHPFSGTQGSVFSFPIQVLPCTGSIPLTYPVKALSQNSSLRPVYYKILYVD